MLGLFLCFIVILKSLVLASTPVNIKVFSCVFFPTQSLKEQLYGMMGLKSHTVFDINDKRIGFFLEQHYEV